MEKLHTFWLNISVFAALIIFCTSILAGQNSLQEPQFKHKSIIFSVFGENLISLFTIAFKSLNFPLETAHSDFSILYIGQAL